jgi:predicted nucleotidyltransferase component of viral defense system
MDIFKQHELFEIEVLDKMRRLKLLDPLVFGGGTMLRLCHELNRYSADLDFWFIKEVPEDLYFSKFKQLIENEYEITDSQMKHFTLLFELRSVSYPKRLKVEIRRKKHDFDFQEKIAFSIYSTHQIVLKALTLEQAMKNKVAAFSDRGEIRDGYDIEFLLRKGVELPSMDTVELDKFIRRLDQFKDVDFKIKLGSILESDVRGYYISQKFAYLREKLLANSSFPKLH